MALSELLRFKYWNNKNPSIPDLASISSFLNGINGFFHRQFLNRFYVNRYEGSFARGVPFQDNPNTGDCRISGTAASLCGLEQHDPHAVARLLLMHGVVFSSGGIPLIYLGDEVATLNDPDYVNDPGKAGDSRWVNRPFRPEVAYAARHDPATTAGRVFSRLHRLLQVRSETPELGGNDLIPFRTPHPSVGGVTAH